MEWVGERVASSGRGGGPVLGVRLARRLIYGSRGKSARTRRLGDSAGVATRPDARSAGAAYTWVIAAPRVVAATLYALMLLRRHSRRAEVVLLSLASAAAAGAQNGIEPTHLGAWSATLHGLESPAGVAFDPRGRVWVVESWADRVRVFDRDGAQRLSVGGSGAGPAELLDPGGIAIAADGTVFVADTGNHRVQVFDGDGAFLRQ